MLGDGLLNLHTDFFIIFDKAINEYKDDPVTYSLDEVDKELGLL